MLLKNKILKRRRKEEEQSEEEMEDEKINSPPYHQLGGNALYAVENRFKMTFLPGISNFFGGFICNHVLVDDGCNTHLLAVQNSNQFRHIVTLFPPFKYTYKMREGRVAQGTPKIALIVEAKNGESIPWKLNTDFCSFSTQGPNYLRFSLCYDDMNIILQEWLPRGYFDTQTDEMLELLENHIRAIQTSFSEKDTKNPVTSAFIGDRNHTSLLGKSIHAGGHISSVDFANENDVSVKIFCRDFNILCELHGNQHFRTKGIQKIVDYGVSLRSEMGMKEQFHCLSDRDDIDM